MSEPLLSVGLLVGETWEIIEPIGRGGMGEVWRAKHVRVESKMAAIKVLRRTTDGMPDQVARFRREAEIAAKLEHPNIVQLFDFSSLPNGAPYLVMELLRGESLGKRLERGPVPLPEWQALLVQIGSALHVAHAAGVVHRDLKPENIFLVATPTGTTVKVLDFGISKLVDSDSLLTSESVVLGTPQYMSPEQAMAEHQTITAQSDLFSLGTICFEALTGHRPFEANTLARTVYLVAMEPSPSLRTFGPELPEPIITAVDHALAKHAEERTPDIATFIWEMCGVSLTTSATKKLKAPKNPSAQTISSRAPAPSRSAWPFAALAAAGLVVAMVLLASNAETPVPVELPQPRKTVNDAGPAPVAPAVEVAVDAGVAPSPSPRVLAVRAQPLTAEQQALFDAAHAAAAKNEWSQVIEWTLKPAIAERADAISLRVLAWCHLGNLPLVTAYKGRIVASERGAIVKACQAQGIDL